MGKIGTTELLVVLAIVLVIFGPKALPKLGRSLGKTLGSFRKGMNDSADDDDDDEDEDDEDEEDGFEVECPNCDEPLFIGDDELAEGVVVCPNCDTRFSLDLSDDTVEGDDGEEE